MQDNKNILASSVNSKDHLTAFDTMIKSRLDAIDLSPMLMYFIDLCPAAALPVLAEQFDVMGFNGWILCDTEADRRALIKRAIELKRFRGTPWAVKEALKSVGYFDAQIQEGFSGYMYNGEIIHDGVQNYGDGHWANFRVSLLDLGETKGFSTETLALIIGMIYKYKNQRSNLLDIVLKATTVDYFEDIVDQLTGQINIPNDADSFNVSRYYDGSFNHDGSNYYISDTSIFELNINLNPFEDVISLPIDSDFLIKIIPLGNDIFITEDDGDEVISETGNKLIDESTVVAYEGP